MTRIVFKMKIARSLSLLIYFVVLHVLMLVTMLSLLGVSWWSVLIFIMIMLSGIYYCRQYQWLNSHQALNQIERDARDKWSLCFQDGKQHSALTLTRSFITPHVVIMYFNKSHFWQRYAVTIVADAVEGEVFRQLRVYLRDPKTFQK